MAAELKSLRAANDLTIEQAAAGIGMSSATLSRIENAQSGVKTPILRALLGVYGVDGPTATDLETLAKEANQRGWWQPLSAPDAFKTVVGLETEATWISYFDNIFVMGLLQTQPYAKAVVDATLLDATTADMDGIVAARMRRQELLPGIHLSVILGEEAFLRPIGGPRVMAGQIERLLEASHDRNIDIQIVARETGEHVGLAGNFEIVGLKPNQPEAVFIEGFGWEACVEDASELITYTRSFDRLRALALGFTETRKLLQRKLEVYKNDGHESGRN